MLSLVLLKPSLITALGVCIFNTSMHKNFVQTIFVQLALPKTVIHEMLQVKFTRQKKLCVLEYGDTILQAVYC